MSSHSLKPHVLIADDDPVSLRFLAAALAQLGCEVATVADGKRALTKARANRFNLLLLDRCMPDLGGAELLAAMRADGIQAVAIATSAEVDAAAAERLRSAGFVDILEKPATLTQVQRAMSPHLHFSPTPAASTVMAAPVTVLDDGPALATIGGDATVLRALRELLAQELAILLTELANIEPRANASALRERLHRLRASCGFCGATALAETAIRLDVCLRDDAGNMRPALEDFLHSCRATQAALADQASIGAGTGTSSSIPQARKPAPSR
ncbi:MAG: response regulator [Rudaea sp.]|nr:response regulator [Rudaea sp.]